MNNTKLLGALCAAATVLSLHGEGGGYEDFVTLTASDSNSQSSMISGDRWSDGLAPSSGKDYYVPYGLDIRTENKKYTEYYEFPGQTLACAGTLYNILSGYKGFGVRDLRMLPGFVYHQSSMNFVGRTDGSDVWTVEGTADEPARFSILFAYGANSVPFYPKFKAGSDAVLEAFRKSNPFSKEWFVGRPYTYYTPDKMIQKMCGSFEEFYGTFRIATNAAVAVTSGMKSMPGTFEVKGGGALRNDMTSGSFTVGALNVHENASVYFTLSSSGGTCSYTITNALVTEAGRPWKISFESSTSDDCDISAALASGTMNLKLFTLSGAAAQSMPDLSGAIIDARPVSECVTLSVRDEGDGGKGVYLSSSDSFIAMTNACGSTQFAQSAFSSANGSYWSTGEVPTPESAAGKTLYAAKTILFNAYLVDGNRHFDFPETKLFVSKKTSVYMQASSAAFKEIRLLGGNTVLTYSGSYAGDAVLDAATGYRMADLESPICSDGTGGNTFCSYQKFGHLLRKGISGANTVTFTTMKNHQSPFGCAALEGDSSAFAGELRFETPTFAAVEGKYAACPDESTKRFFTATFSSGANFGGVYGGAGASAWRSIYVNGHTLMVMTNDVEIVEPTRTMFVDDCGRFEVAEGKTFSLAAPLTLKGELRKTGKGRIALNGEARFANADNPDPLAGTNVFNVVDGEAMFSGVNSANGLAITFSEGAKLAVDPESAAAKSATGFLATRWATPLASTAADGQILVALAPKTGFVPEVTFSVPICTVPAAAAQSLSFRPLRYGKHSGRVRAVENADGTVTFVADYIRKGMVVTVR